MRRALLVLGLLSACKPTPPKDTDVTPIVGSTGPTAETGPTINAAAPRLVRLGIDGKPTTRDLTESDAFFDNERDEICNFNKVGETWRCVPTNRMGVYFADAACTQRITFVRAPVCGDKAAEYAASNELDSTDAFLSVWGMRLALFKIGAAVTTPAQVYSGEGCEEVATPSGTAHAITSDDGSTLAAGTFEWRAGTTGRVRQAVITANDGDVPVIDYFGTYAFDSELDVTCDFYAQEDLSCDPWVSTVSQAYSDDSCTAEIDIVQSQPKKAVNKDGTVYRVSNVNSVQAYVTDDDDMCGESDAAYTFTLGAVVPNVSGTLKNVDSGNVRTKYIEADGLRFLHSRVDLTNDRQCYGMITADGETRCGPADAFYGKRYIDASCSDAVVAGNPNGLLSETSPLYLGVYPDACSAEVTFHEVGTMLPESDEPLYIKNRAGACVADAYSTRLKMRYRLGAVVDPTLFPLLTF